MDYRCRQHRRLLQMTPIPVALVLCGLTAICQGKEDTDAARNADRSFVVMTFNTGTTKRLSHNNPPEDGYTSAHAEISHAHYGNGLAWCDAIKAVRRLIERVDPDIVAFQEMFYSENCADIPADARRGFVCETWTSGDPSVARRVLGDDYQIAGHPEKPNKCVAVHRRFGTIRGCRGDFCLDGLEGHPLPGCGSGCRVARAIIDRTNGETLTLISVHGTSGRLPADQACRVRQVNQIFVDFGDGAPAASGRQNLILGDFNTDPGKATLIDASAVRWNDFVGQRKAFHFISRVGPNAPRAYLGFVDIDHVVSDVFHGSCRYLGVDEGSAPVFAGTYFDHVPVICTISE